MGHGQLNFASAFGAGGTASYDVPALLSSVPVNGATNVNPASPIEFLLYADAGIDLLSLKVFLDGKLALVGSTFQTGFAGTISTNPDGTTIYFTSHLAFNQPTVDAVIEVADELGHFSVFSLSFTIAFSTVSSASSRSWCSGKRIDLGWANPAGTTRVKIRRSTVGYPRFTDDPGQDIYEGAPITAFVDGVYTGPTSTTNVALEENKFYYYTIFYTFSASAPYTWARSLSSEIQGLSIKDYMTADGHYVYDLLPAKVREEDSAPSRGTDRYKTRDYADTLQCGVNLYRGWIESLLLLRDPDTMPAGRLGDSENNYGILAAQCWDYGLPAGLSLDAATLRRLAFSLVTLYENKGHCANLVTLAKTVTTWDSRCEEMAEPLCGVNRLAYTWDAESFINQCISSLSANNATVSVAGQVTLKVSRLFDALGTTASGALATVPSPAFIIDALGTFACIDHANAVSGSDQVLVFSDVLAKLRTEIAGSGTGSLNQFVITSINTSSYPWQFPTPLAAPTFGPNAFAGLKLMDSAGTVFTIVSSVETSGANTTLTVVGTPATGNYSVAAAFDPAGATYGTRIPLFSAKIYSGEFSLTYSPLWDIRLKSELKVGPWSLTTSLTSTLASAWAPTPNDVILVIQNAHADKGNLTGVSTNSVSDTTKSWGTDVWRGHYLLADWNQPRLFRVISNNSNTLIVEIPSGSGGLNTLASVGANYVLLTEKNAIRYSNLLNMMPSFLPIDSNPYIKFETV